MNLNDVQYLNKNMILNRVNHLIIYGIDSYYSFSINHAIPDKLLERIYDNLIISILSDEGSEKKRIVITVNINTLSGFFSYI